jgi:hypothetical protein
MHVVSPCRVEWSSKRFQSWPMRSTSQPVSGGGGLPAEKGESANKRADKARLTAERLDFPPGGEQGQSVLFKLTHAMLRYV